ncbi:MAG TPA: DNA ligase D [Terriglobia bacterium]|nr:DNA ligase D [Terriglobia bacterium]
MGLEEYKRKRRFHETPEPEGAVKRTRGMSFVIQKHRATRLHYDFRLEMEGVLRSWAIPKGPSFNPAEKRLAVETEDHPMDYGGFEGVIPKGNYGAGNVIVWDRGTYEMVDPDTPEAGWKKGKLHFVLNGDKLHGEWVLVRGSREPKQWIFFKVRDSFARANGDITEERPESVVSGEQVEDLGGPAKSAAGKGRDGAVRRWHTPIERELEQRGMKKAGRTPLPKDVRPMLATLGEKPFDNDDWLFELKLDGVRALVVKNGDKLDLWTRNQKSMTRRFPTLADALLALPANSAILDGEIVALDEEGHSHFGRIQPRLHLSRQRDIAEADQNIPVHFYAFDLLYLNGHDLTSFPVVERKAVLRAIIPDNSGWVRYLDHVEGRGADFFKAVARRNLEGIVAKQKSSVYREGRSRYWIKIKTHNVDRFVVGGFTPPEGSRKGFGALLLGLYDREGRLVYVGRAGGGFDDRMLAETTRRLRPLAIKRSPFVDVPAEIRKASWVRPELVCSVRFGEWTSDRKLRTPIFQGFVDDVDPRECALETALPAKLGRAGDEDDPPPAAPPEKTRTKLTNLTKIFWPEDGYTKGDLIAYYDRIAPAILPHLLDRPLVFKRYPNGIHGEYFYQKDAHEYTPDWVRTVTLWSPDVERNIRYFVGSDREQLLYIANMGAITQNPWSSRLQFLDRPDFIIFDLDPVEAPYPVVQEVALEVKAALDELEMRAYPKTSGASGIHVYLPILENRFTYDDVRVFAEAVASIVVARRRDIATIERVVRKRKKGVIYVDYLQNVRGKTVASVYSPRAEIGAPVSTPLTWEEIRRPLDPKDYNIRTVFQRLDRMGEMFRPVLTDRQDISPFLKALRAKK